VFDPEPVLAVNMEIYSSELLDQTYLLLACEKGLFFVDMTAEERVPVPILQNIRFKQIEISKQHNVLMALSGKRDHIRQYNLSSIRKLIRYLQGQDPMLLKKMDFSVPIQQATEAKKTHAVDDEYMQARDEDVHDETALVSSWCSDYIKIQGTQHSKAFMMTDTETTSYLTVLFKQDLTLFEWAKKPYSKFMKLKAFWLPEAPKFMNVSQDGMDLKDIYLGYNSELNLVSSEDSKVKEISVHKEFSVKQSSKERWRSFVQIPLSEAKLKAYITKNLRSNSKVNQKLAAITSQTIARGTDAHDRYFLGTFNRVTKVVDKMGIPISGPGVGGWQNGVIWTEPPNLLVLRPHQHVMSAGLNTVEIVDWKTADLRQRFHVDATASLEILNSSHGSTILSIVKKKKGCAIYYLKEHTPPPRPPGQLLKAISASAPVDNSASHEEDAAIEEMRKMDLAPKGCNVSEGSVPATISVSQSSSKVGSHLNNASILPRSASPIPKALPPPTKPLPKV
jgi:uncharacterized protein YueI